MEINQYGVYVIDDLSYMCIAKNEKYTIMAAYYSDDEDSIPQLDMSEVMVYSSVNPEYGPIEKIMDFSGKGRIVFE